MFDRLKFCPIFASCLKCKHRAKYTKNACDYRILKYRIMEETNETNVCELCGREYIENDFTRDAPFAMCDSCYEEYLLTEAEEEIG